MFNINNNNNNNNSSGIHRPPAPIFNLSKRPRQALISDPGEGKPFTGHNVGHNRLVADHGGQDRRWNLGNPQNSSRYQPAASKPCHPVHQNIPQNQPQVRKFTSTSGTTTVPTSNQFQSNKGQSKHSGMPYGQQGHQRPSMGRGNQPTREQGQGPSSDSRQCENRNFQQLRQTGNVPTRRPGFLDVGPSGGKQICPKPSTHQIAPSSHQGFSTQAYNRSQWQPSNSNPFYNQPVASQQSTATDKSVSNLPAKKATQDKSLHVISSTIHSMKQEANTRDSIPVLFELFGIIDSAVTMNDRTQGKEFMLKDETGVLGCVFFEIDRSLARLTRGQWQRCMGTYDHKLDKFKCVSVRPTNPAERSLAKVTSRVCEQTMRSVVSGLRET